MVSQIRVPFCIPLLICWILKLELWGVGGQTLPSDNRTSSKSKVNVKLVLNVEYITEQGLSTDICYQIRYSTGGPPSDENSSSIAATECSSTTVKYPVTTVVATPGRNNRTGNMTYITASGFGVEGSKFRFKANHTQGVMLVGLQSGMCLNIYENGKDINSPLNLFTCNSSSANQRFFMVSAGNEYFYVIVAHSGLCLNTNHDAKGSNVVQSTCIIKNPCHLWYVKETYPCSGKYYLQQKSSGFLMNISGGGTSDGSPCIIWDKPASEDFRRNEVFVPRH